MTTQELMKIVKERGLRIDVKDGRPVLVGAAGNPAVTDNLLKVLKRHRERIVSEISKGQ